MLGSSSATAETVVPDRNVSSGGAQVAPRPVCLALSRSARVGNIPRWATSEFKRGVRVIGRWDKQAEKQRAMIQAEVLQPCLAIGSLQPAGTWGSFGLDKQAE